MKNLIVAFLIMMITYGCHKHKSIINIDNNVKVKFDYHLVSSGGLKSYQEQYQAFHTKYIESRILTPKTYTLTLTGTKGNIINLNGNWELNKYFIIAPDTYTIIGESFPTENLWSGDSCYFKFNETITIDKTTTNISLNANYYCFLCLFSNIGITTTYVHNPYESKTTLMKTEDFYHVFMQDNNPNEPNDYRYITLTRTDGTTSVVYTKDYNLVFGKYYYFNFISLGYTVAPMSE